MTSAETAEICRDLTAEEDALDRVVSALDPADWDRDTLAEGWRIRDQIGHLAFGEDLAVLAAGDPEAFFAEMNRAAADVGGYLTEALDRGRALEPQALLGWWRASRRSTIAIVGGLDPETRVPWVGPPMKPRSFLTARLMETFAHGTDVRDALGIETVPTHRLRHVAHLGVITRAFSYTNRGRTPPEVPVRVELLEPDGGLLEWGPRDASDRVSGPVLDFCLVVTQRIHPADTGLEITGAAATEWMAIAQCFAGPPTDGRPPRGAPGVSVAAPR